MFALKVNNATPAITAGAPAWLPLSVHSQARASCHSRVSLRLLLFRVFGFLTLSLQFLLPLGGERDNDQGGGRPDAVPVKDSRLVLCLAQRRCSSPETQPRPLEAG